MSKKNKNHIHPRTNLEIIQSIRGDWHGVNPVTKIIPDKRKKKDKHKKKYDAEE